MSLFSCLATSNELICIEEKPKVNSVSA